MQSTVFDTLLFHVKKITKPISKTYQSSVSKDVKERRFLNYKRTFENNNHSVLIPGGCVVDSCPIVFASDASKAPLQLKTPFRLSKISCISKIEKGDGGNLKEKSNQLWSSRSKLAPFPTHGGKNNSASGYLSHDLDANHLLSVLAFIGSTVNVQNCGNKSLFSANVNEHAMSQPLASFCFNLGVSPMQNQIIKFDKSIQSTCSQAALCTEKGYTLTVLPNSNNQIAEYALKQNIEKTPYSDTSTSINEANHSSAIIRNDSNASQPSYSSFASRRSQIWNQNQSVSNRDDCYFYESNGSTLCESDTMIFYNTDTYSSDEKDKLLSIQQNVPPTDSYTFPNFNSCSAITKKCSTSLNNSYVAETNSHESASKAEKSLASSSLSDVMRTHFFKNMVFGFPGFPLTKVYALESAEVQSQTKTFSTTLSPVDCPDLNETCGTSLNKFTISRTSGDKKKLNNQSYLSTQRYQKPFTVAQGTSSCVKIKEVASEPVSSSQHTVSKHCSVNSSDLPLESRVFSSNFLSNNYLDHKNVPPSSTCVGAGLKSKEFKSSSTELTPQHMNLNSSAKNAQMSSQVSDFDNCAKKNAYKVEYPNLSSADLKTGATSISTSKEKQLYATNSFGKLQKKFDFSKMSNQEYQAGMTLSFGSCVDQEGIKSGNHYGITVSETKGSKNSSSVTQQYSNDFTESKTSEKSWKSFLTKTPQHTSIASDDKRQDEILNIMIDEQDQCQPSTKKNSTTANNQSVRFKSSQLINQENPVELKISVGSCVGHDEVESDCHRMITVSKAKDSRNNSNFDKQNFDTIESKIPLSYNAQKFWKSYRKNTPQDLQTSLNCKIQDPCLSNVEKLNDNNAETEKKSNITNDQSVKFDFIKMDNQENQAGMTVSLGSCINQDDIKSDCHHTITLTKTKDSKNSSNISKQSSEDIVESKTPFSTNKKFWNLLFKNAPSGLLLTSDNTNFKHNPCHSKAEKFDSIKAETQSKSTTANDQYAKFESSKLYNQENQVAMTVSLGSCIDQNEMKSDCHYAITLSKRNDLKNSNNVSKQSSDANANDNSLSNNEKTWKSVFRNTSLDRSSFLDDKKQDPCHSNIENVGSKRSETGKKSTTANDQSLKFKSSKLHNQENQAGMAVSLGSCVVHDEIKSDCHYAITLSQTKDSKNSNNVSKQSAEDNVVYKTLSNSEKSWKSFFKNTLQDQSSSFNDKKRDPCHSNVENFHSKISETDKKLTTPNNQSVKNKFSKKNQTGMTVSLGSCVDHDKIRSDCQHTITASKAKDSKNSSNVSKEIFENVIECKSSTNNEKSWTPFLKKNLQKQFFTSDNKKQDPCHSNTEKLYCKISETEKQSTTANDQYVKFKSSKLHNQENPAEMAVSLGSCVDHDDIKPDCYYTITVSKTKDSNNNNNVGKQSSEAHVEEKILSKNEKSWKSFFRNYLQDQSFFDEKKQDPFRNKVEKLDSKISETEKSQTLGNDQSVNNKISKMHNRENQDGMSISLGSCIDHDKIRSDCQHTITVSKAKDSKNSINVSKQSSENVIKSKHSSSNEKSWKSFLKNIPPEQTFTSDDKKQDHSNVENLDSKISETEKKSTTTNDQYVKFEPSKLYNQQNQNEMTVSLGSCVNQDEIKSDCPHKITVSQANDSKIGNNVSKQSSENVIESQTSSSNEKSWNSFPKKTPQKQSFTFNDKRQDLCYSNVENLDSKISETDKKSTTVNDQYLKFKSSKMCYEENQSGMTASLSSCVDDDEINSNCQHTITVSKAKDSKNSNNINKQSSENVIESQTSSSSEKFWKSFSQKNPQKQSFTFDEKKQDLGYHNIENLKSKISETEKQSTTANDQCLKFKSSKLHNQQNEAGMAVSLGSCVDHDEIKSDCHFAVSETKDSKKINHVSKQSSEANVEDKTTSNNEKSWKSFFTNTLQDPCHSSVENLDSKISETEKKSTTTNNQYVKFEPSKLHTQQNQNGMTVSLGSCIDHDEIKSDCQHKITVSKANDSKNSFNVSKQSSENVIESQTSSSNEKSWKSFLKKTPQKQSFTFNDKRQDLCYSNVENLDSKISETDKKSTTANDQYLKFKSSKMCYEKNQSGMTASLSSCVDDDEINSNCQHTITVSKAKDSKNSSNVSRLISGDIVESKTSSSNEKSWKSFFKNTPQEQSFTCNDKKQDPCHSNVEKLNSKISETGKKSITANDQCLKLKSSKLHNQQNQNGMTVSLGSCVDQDEIRSDCKHTITVSKANDSRNSINVSKQSSENVIESQTSSSNEKSWNSFPKKTPQKQFFTFNDKKQDLCHSNVENLNSKISETEKQSTTANDQCLKFKSSKPHNQQNEAGMTVSLGSCVGHDEIKSDCHFAVSETKDSKKINHVSKQSSEANVEDKTTSNNEKSWKSFFTNTLHDQSSFFNDKKQDPCHSSVENLDSKISETEKKSTTTNDQYVKFEPSKLHNQQNQNGMTVSLGSCVNQDKIESDCQHKITVSKANDSKISNNVSKQSSENVIESQTSSSNEKSWKSFLKKTPQKQSFTFNDKRQDLCYSNVENLDSKISETDKKSTTANDQYLKFKSSKMCYEENQSGMTASLSSCVDDDEINSNCQHTITVSKAKDSKNSSNVSRLISGDVIESKSSSSNEKSWKSFFKNTPQEQSFTCNDKKQDPCHSNVEKLNSKISETGKKSITANDQCLKLKSSKLRNQENHAGMRISFGSCVDYDEIDSNGHYTVTLSRAKNSKNCSNLSKRIPEDVIESKTFSSNKKNWKSFLKNTPQDLSSTSDDKKQDPCHSNAEELDSKLSETEKKSTTENDQYVKLISSKLCNQQNEAGMTVSPGSCADHDEIKSNCPYTITVSKTKDLKNNSNASKQSFKDGVESKTTSSNEKSWKSFFRHTPQDQSLTFDDRKQDPCHSNVEKLGSKISETEKKPTVANDQYIKFKSSKMCNEEYQSGMSNSLGSCVDHDEIRSDCHYAITVSKTKDSYIGSNASKQSSKAVIESKISSPSNNGKSWKSFFASAPQDLSSSFDDKKQDLCHSNVEKLDSKKAKTEKNPTTANDQTVKYKASKRFNQDHQAEMRVSFGSCVDQDEFKSDCHYTITVSETENFQDNKNLSKQEFKDVSESKMSLSPINERSKKSLFKNIPQENLPIISDDKKHEKQLNISVVKQVPCHSSMDKLDIRNPKTPKIIDNYSLTRSFDGTVSDENCNLGKLFTTKLSPLCVLDPAKLEMGVKYSLTATKMLNSNSLCQDFKPSPTPAENIPSAVGFDSDHCKSVESKQYSFLSSTFSGWQSHKNKESLSDKSFQISENNASQKTERMPMSKTTEVKKMGACHVPNSISEPYDEAQYPKTATFSIKPSGQIAHDKILSTYFQDDHCAVVDEMLPKGKCDLTIYSKAHTHTKNIAEGKTHQFPAVNTASKNVVECNTESQQNEASVNVKSITSFFSKLYGLLVSNKPSSTSVTDDLVKNQTADSLELLSPTISGLATDLRPVKKCPKHDNLVSDPFFKLTVSVGNEMFNHRQKLAIKEQVFEPKATSVISHDKKEVQPEQSKRSFAVDSLQEAHRQFQMKSSTLTSNKLFYSRLSPAKCPVEDNLLAENSCNLTIWIGGSQKSKPTSSASYIVSSLTKAECLEDVSSMSSFQSNQNKAFPESNNGSFSRPFFKFAGVDFPAAVYSTRMSSDCRYKNEDVSKVCASCFTKEDCVDERQIQSTVIADHGTVQDVVQPKAQIVTAQKPNSAPVQENSKKRFWKRLSTYKDSFSFEPEKNDYNNEADQESKQKFKRLWKFWKSE